ncbi:MAG: N-acetylmuramoyl-L-alanine amidase [Phycisphaerales bacterium]|nr:MAG: N-acetylmuramoyl-L-alanine amidase [Phycisphaerales bacterium]
MLHHSATTVGGARTFDKHHRSRNGWDELGYHFVIGNGTDTPDGYVEVGSRWHKQKHGAHCKTPSNYYNEHGIGICLVGNFNKIRPTARQLRSLEQLLRFLSHTCRIPPSRVTTHKAVTGKTQCPGRRFPMAAVRQALPTRLTATSLP